MFYSLPKVLLPTQPSRWLGYLPLSSPHPQHCPLGSHRADLVCNRHKGALGPQQLCFHLCPWSLPPSPHCHMGIGWGVGKRTKGKREQDVRFWVKETSMPQYLGGIGRAAFQINLETLPPMEKQTTFPRERAQITATTSSHCPDGIKL